MSLVTMFTDAGWSRTHSIGVWAVWAKCNGTRIRYAGQAKMPVLQSGQAELVAIANGLSLIARNFAPNAGSRIIVQTDSEEAMLALKRRFHRRPETKPALDHILKFTYEHNWHLDLRHVKGHSGDVTSRHAVNAWCDTECKRLMTQALRAIEPELNFAA
jgi:ribonuclease HI